VVSRRVRPAFAAAMLCAALPARAAETREHRVERGETLWSISARADVYGDPFLWPVIYKWNRDQIEDPARIYPNQLLVLPLDVDEATRAAARVEAGAPAAVPSQPTP
ncbi:MAG: LysM peptidoglycan-binding domain-containing protein, partial [Candidatus Rokuibacteriota bacterium]